MARERDQLSAALEVTENEWAEARAEAEAGKGRGRASKAPSGCPGGESRCANEKVEVKAAQTRRAAATAEQRAKAAEVTAAAEATATAASAAAAKEIERMRRLLSATAENARNAASSDLAAARRVAEAAKRTAQAARSRAERDAAQMRKALEKKESQIEAFVEKPRWERRMGSRARQARSPRHACRRGDGRGGGARRAGCDYGDRGAKAAPATAEEVAVSQRAAVEFIERTGRWNRRRRRQRPWWRTGAAGAGHVERRRPAWRLYWCPSSQRQRARGRRRPLRGS